MTRALKWKLIVGFVLVFLAGGMTGALIVASHTRHQFFGQYHSAIGDRIRNRLRTQLGLTNEQMAKISPVIDQTASQLEAVRGETARRVHQIFAEEHREIAADLTPEQRAKLQAIEERHRRWLHRLHGGHKSPAPETSSSTPE
jgi:Spy/CpxP family protein refolding chaperone